MSGELTATMKERAGTLSLPPDEPAPADVMPAVLPPEGVRAFTPKEIASRVLEQRRVDVSGVRGCAAAVVVSAIAQQADRRVVLVTADLDSARRAADEIGFFLRSGDQDAEDTGEGDVLVFAASDTSPYADVSGKWAFEKDSYLNVGLRHQLNATDAVSPTINATSSSIILNQESTLLYATVAHNFTPDFRVSVNGQYQNSVFKGGVADGQTENFYGLGLQLTYSFSKYLAAEASYFYDDLSTSSLPSLSARGYSRNRVFLGVRATY